MTMIDDFLDLLALWRDRGAVTFDSDDVARPHTSIRAFDHAAFAVDAQRLRAAGVAAAGAIGEAGGRHGLNAGVWSGDGGAAAQVASTQARSAAVGALQALQGQVAVMTAADAVLGAVVSEYRSSMAAATAPMSAGLALPEATEELDARLDLAARTGRAASEAVDEAVGVLGDHWRSAGELVIAGDR